MIHATGSIVLIALLNQESKQKAFDNLPGPKHLTARSRKSLRSLSTVRFYYFIILSVKLVEFRDQNFYQRLELHEWGKLVKEMLLLHFTDNLEMCGFNSHFLNVNLRLNSFMDMLSINSQRRPVG